MSQNQVEVTTQGQLVAEGAPVVSLKDLAPFALLGLVLMAFVYLVVLEEGAVQILSSVPVHEWVHDGRHLLGFPCH